MDVKEYLENISTAENDQTITALRAELAARLKQTYTALKQIMTMMKLAMTAGGVPLANNTNR